MSVQHPALRGFVPIYWRGSSTSVALAALRFDKDGYFDAGDPSFDPNVVTAARAVNEGGNWPPGKIGLPRIVSASGSIGPQTESNLGWPTSDPQAFYSIGSNEVWGAFVEGPPGAGLTAKELSFSTSSGQVYRNAAGWSDGEIRNHAVWMRTKSGTLAVRLQNPGGGAGRTCTVTTTWQRFTDSFVVGTSGGAGTAHPAIRAPATNFTQVFEVAWPQYENTTGHPDPTLPSVLVQTETGAAFRLANYYNPNTVDAGGVVTKGAHVAITDPPGGAPNPTAEFYTQRYPAATQLCTQPLDLTSVAWNKTNCSAAFDAVGLDGTQNNASTLTATSADATCLFNHTSAAVDFTAAMWVKRKTGTGVVEITVDGGGNWISVTLNDYFRPFFASANVANPAFGIAVKTSGDEVIVGAANLFADNADVVRGLPPVFDTSPIAAAGGGNWAASVLGDPDKATLVTVELLPRFELDRAVQDILLSTAQNLLFGPSAGVNLQSNDGTNTSSVAIGQTTTDTPVFMGVFFGVEGLQVRINDSVGTLVPYNGNFSSGLLSLLETLNASAGARGLLVTKGKDLAALGAAYDQLYEWFALELNSPLVTDESGNVLTDDAGAIITL